MAEETGISHIANIVDDVSQALNYRLIVEKPGIVDADPISYQLSIDTLLSNVLSFDGQGNIDGNNGSLINFTNIECGYLKADVIDTNNGKKNYLNALFQYEGAFNAVAGSFVTIIDGNGNLQKNVLSLHPDQDRVFSPKTFNYRAYFDFFVRIGPFDSGDITSLLIQEVQYDDDGNVVATIQRYLEERGSVSNGSYLIWNSKFLINSPANNVGLFITNGGVGVSGAKNCEILISCPY